MAFLGGGALLAAGGLVLLVRAGSALCAGPVDTYPVIAAARDEAAVQAEQSAPSSPPALAARAQAQALTLLLAVKQADVVSFPAHALAGGALELAGCPAGSTGDQWRKAAGHAWAGWPARVAAAGLHRTLDRRSGSAATLATLQRYATDEPWHAANLDRVIALYRAEPERS